MPNLETRPTSFGERLTALQVRRPLLFLAVALAITAGALLYAARLRIQTGFDSLLPESRPSVQELRRVSTKVSGVSTLFVILRGDQNVPTAALRKAADALVPEIEKLGPPWVGHAESGVHEAMHFLLPRAGLFLSTDKVHSLTQDIKTTYAQAVGEATGLLVDLDDEPKPKTKTFSTLRTELEGEGLDPNRYPDGYYQTADGHMVIVLVRSQVPSGDFDRGAEVIDKVNQVVQRIDLASFAPGIRVDYSGDMATSVAEYKAINRDLTDVGIAGSLMIAAVVFLYYLRARMVAVMLLTIGVGVAWTFGATQLTVGRLNLATGFLFTIVGGNGINFGILYMARFIESRRRGAALLEGLQIAQRETWVPTLTAACAAAASYGSLAITDFRGFHDFGLIGGIGMLLCWVATFWVLPCLLTVAERLAPIDQLPSGDGRLASLRRFISGGIPFARPFEWLVFKAPRTIAVISLAVTALGLAGGAWWVFTDPMEYDLLNLRTDASARAEEIRLNDLGHEVTGAVGASGMAIVVDTPEQVAQLRAVLNHRRDQAPADLKPFEAVHSLQDFVPDDQAAKLADLQQMRHWLLKARSRGAIDDADWAQVEPLLPPVDLQPFALDDLPEGVARAFTESDGTRGRIVYISPTKTASVDDAHYLFRWADSYRQTPLPDGTVIRGSGRAVIYADIWAQVLHDAPRAVLLSLVATALVVLLAFRSRASLAVLGSLLVGTVWMVGLLALMRVKLNFLNFIALPITFGIGVDYAVNIVQRYWREGPGSALLAIRETGGAVTLCSLTTTLGYLALVRSNNFAVRSLGLAAFFGEVCCLLAAVLMLPAALTWLDARRAARAVSAAQAPALVPVRQEQSPQ